MKFKNWSEFEIVTYKLTFIGWVITVIGIIINLIPSLEWLSQIIVFGGFFLMMFSFLYWFTAHANRKEIIFVKHIKRHLDKDHKVICKICDKDIDTIFKEERGGIK